MIKFYTAANLTEAYLIRDLLAADHIASNIFNENAQGALGEIPFTHAYPEIWLIDERDLPQARNVIREYEGNSAASRSLHCPSCGEDNPANFEVCWQCGRELSKSG